MCGRLVPITVQTFFLTLLRPHNSNPYVSKTHDCFYFWNTIPASPTFFPAARKECRPRKDRRPVIPPGRSGPSNLAPAGPGSIPMGGELHQCFPIFLQTQNCKKKFFIVMQIRPHGKGRILRNVRPPP